MIVRALKVLGCSLHYYVRFLADLLLGKLLDLPSAYYSGLPS